ncbi:hypothetical protein [Rhodococcus opacus]|uniref:hypothetical protein n=1 Tax=Rhodococcus opacus TaxID=37919 RepID=UPI001F5448D6|nr:hypothetical protein [Rhodococcus opacus]
MGYSASPDGPPAHLDPELGRSNSPAVKPVGYRTEASHQDRAAERSSARELDDMVEDSAFTRARKDLERAFPRAAVADVSPRKRRQLPIPGSHPRPGNVRHARSPKTSPRPSFQPSDTRRWTP